MRKLVKIVVISCLALSIQFAVVEPTQAQCPMCKMAAESNLKNGGTAGKGLNAGILFLLGMPYILVGTIGYVWYRNRTKEEELK